MTQDLTSVPPRGLAELPTQTALNVLTGVRGVISAAHRSRDGHLHGHTWTVRAWFKDCPCAVEKQAELTKYLSIFDHQVLGDAEAWGEALAQSILWGMTCHRVEVSRDAEGIYAMAERIKQ